MICYELKPPAQRHGDRAYGGWAGGHDAVVHVVQQWRRVSSFTFFDNCPSFAHCFAGSCGGIALHEETAPVKPVSEFISQSTRTYYIIACLSTPLSRALWDTGYGVGLLIRLNKLSHICTASRRPTPACVSLHQTASVPRLHDSDGTHGDCTALRRWILIYS